MDFSITDRAYSFADHAHAGQTHSGAPYVHHLARVVGILFDDNFRDPEIIAAAWLHDVIEDCGVDRGLIAHHFSARVADLVWACSGVGKNRRERNADIAGKLYALPDAIPIKLADRIDNVSSCWERQDGRLFMYHREYPDFRRVVDTGAKTNAAMLSRLDGLMCWRPRE